MILRYLAFVRNLSVGFLLSRVVVNNMVVVFRFAVALVDNNQYLLDFLNKKYSFEVRNLIYVVGFFQLGLHLNRVCCLFVWYLLRFY